jgi:heme peroxidase/catalase
MSQFRQRYDGGSPRAEYVEFQRLAQDIMRVQVTNAKTASAGGVPHGPDRAFHAKSTLAVDGARLRFADDLPEDLRFGFAKPGESYPAVVRFSNASGVPKADTEPDLRGVALRIRVGEDESHDLLMTNFPVSHARNAHQFVEFAKATAGTRVSQGLGVLRLVRLFGLKETVRMLKNVMAARNRPVTSVATETYWSRGAMRWGPELAVRYLLRPAPDTVPAPAAPADDPEFLSTEIGRRLAAGDVAFELCIQRFVDKCATPIEDTAVPWRERDSPSLPVAVLTIPQGDTSSVDALARAREIDAMAFNPWNTTPEFEPLGNLNRARKAVYDAGSAQRLGYRWQTTPPRRNDLVGAASRAGFRLLNRRVEWHRLPVWLAIFNLEALRYVLRKRNLYDTQEPDAPPSARPVPPPAPAEPARISRTYDGTENDMSAPHMGAVGATFGRNMRPKLRPDLFDQPNPILVSRELLHRERFIPARSLNILAAAWIQFQVHDWVAHPRVPLGEQDVVVPLLPGMTWANVKDGPDEPTMRIAGNVEVERTPLSPAFENTISHWWDGSEVYGADAATAQTLRTGADRGKLYLPEGYLPQTVRGAVLTGFTQSWWLGLSSLHTLFAREHNAVCDALSSEYPGMSDDRIYTTARLIVSALIAKIHTVEWTPAILATKTIDVALNANWNGPPGDWLTKLGLWLVDTHASVGIPKTTPDHHGVPYSLTEEFVTVYRMHPLLPDTYRFVRHATGEPIEERDFLEIQGDNTDAKMREYGLEDALYSFGIAHPGAITLHNNPVALEKFIRDGEIIDLSVVDLVRTRRRGVLRYNDFRAALHKPRITKWSDLCRDQASVAIMRRLYGSIDEVDTMVGLFAETPPAGFGFSDTAFRIFALMASRRIQSDRFLTVDFRPEVYTPLGMDWVARNGMTSVILRHCPELAATLPRTASAFAPWRPIAPGAVAGAAGEEG